MIHSESVSSCIMSPVITRPVSFNNVYAVAACFIAAGASWVDLKQGVPYGCVPYGCPLSGCVPYLTSSVCVSMSILNSQESDSVIGREPVPSAGMWLCVSCMVTDPLKYIDRFKVSIDQYRKNDTV